MTPDFRSHGAAGDEVSRGFLRTLIHLPIIHTQADMGDLAGAVKAASLQKGGRIGLARKLTAIEKVWAKIEETLEKLNLPYQQVRLYQDGLPVCGREREIVTELAQAGSRNHQLLLSLVDRGATLMGTESGDLLVQEYELAKQTISPEGKARRGKKALQPSLSAVLLNRRDQFIARRINETLGKGETGILFLGMLHSIENLLDKDIRVIHPLRLNH